MATTTSNTTNGPVAATPFSSLTWQQVMGLTPEGRCTRHPEHQIWDESKQTLNPCPGCLKELGAPSEPEEPHLVPQLPLLDMTRVWARLVVCHAEQQATISQVQGQLADATQTVTEQSQTIRALRRTIQNDLKLIKTMATQKQWEIDQQAAAAAAAAADGTAATTSPNKSPMGSMYGSPTKKTPTSLISPPSSASSNASPASHPAPNPRLQAQMQFFQRASRARGLLPADSMRHMNASKKKQLPKTSVTESGGAILEEGDEDEEETEDTFAGDDDQDIVLPVPPSMLGVVNGLDAATPRLARSSSNHSTGSSSNSSYWTDADRSLASDPSKLFASFRGGLLDIPKSPPKAPTHESSSVKKKKLGKLQLNPTQRNALQIPATSRHGGMPATPNAVVAAAPLLTPADGLQNNDAKMPAAPAPPRELVRQNSVEDSLLLTGVPSQPPRPGRKKKKPAVGAAMRMMADAGNSSNTKEISLDQLAESLTKLPLDSRKLGDQSPEQFFPETVSAAAARNTLPGAPMLDSSSHNDTNARPPVRNLLSMSHNSSTSTITTTGSSSTKSRSFAPLPKLLSVDEETTSQATGATFGNVPDSLLTTLSCGSSLDEDDVDDEHAEDDNQRTGSASKTDKFLFPVTGAECQDRYGDVGTYSGTILVTEGLPHGQGTMNYESGRVYSGEWVSGQWNGKGKLLNPNGDTYQGEFVFDARHGKGVYHWDNGDVYTGMFRDDKRHGHGQFCFHNGNIYEGEFCDGMFDGYGQYKFDGGYYEGDWKEGKYHGNGELTYASGGKYSGEFRNSVAHGFGTEVTPDGVTRRGVWENGQPTEQPGTAPKQPHLGVD